MTFLSITTIVLFVGALAAYALILRSYAHATREPANGTDRIVALGVRLGVLNAVAIFGLGLLSVTAAITAGKARQNGETLQAQETQLRDTTRDACDRLNVQRTSTNHAFALNWLSGQSQAGLERKLSRVTHNPRTHHKSARALSTFTALQPWTPLTACLAAERLGHRYRRPKPQAFTLTDALYWTCALTYDAAPKEPQQAIANAQAVLLQRKYCRRHRMRTGPELLAHPRG
jgi:hypothetical protein